MRQGREPQEEAPGDDRSAAAGRAGTGARHRPLRIGITGPIGCGKSTVAGWLAARGAVVVDADAIARSVTAPDGPILAAIVEQFGSGILASDGSLDRGALAAIVFADDAALAALESIVHPAVRPQLVAAVARAEAAMPPAVVVEAIKLVEGGYARECDEVWLVVCEPAEQRERLARRGLARADAERRIAAQADLVERLAPEATRIVDTSGPRADAEERVALEFAAALAAGAAEGRVATAPDREAPPDGAPG